MATSAPGDRWRQAPGADPALIDIVTSTTESTFVVTFFPTYAATTKSEEALTLSALAERIRDTSAPRKEMLPWLKLARFGNKRTDKGSLRHDANVLAISGVEADYDGERVTIDEACKALEQQGIAAMVYSSPSHTEDAPRFRVLCPLSEVMPPARRHHVLGRLNGLLRGILAHESWTLSQSYYFGSVGGNPSHRVVLIDGTPIDLHDDLDEIWIGKPGAANGAVDVPQHVGGELREDAELIRCVVTGEHLHVELCALAARFVGRGIPGETLKGVLRGIMLSHPDGARDERWLDRYSSIDGLVASAIEKYARKIEESQRALARLAGRLIQARQPSEQVRTQVLVEAARQGIEPEKAERIITWVAQREIAKRASHDASR